MGSMLTETALKLLELKRVLVVSLTACGLDAGTCSSLESSARADAREVSAEKANHPLEI